MNISDSRFVDHFNHNGLDNRRVNLRICTNSQNQMNRKPNKNSRSKFKGIRLHKRGQVWEARIMLDGKSLYLGGFKKEIDAARAYNKAALEIFGEFAYLNKFEELEGGE